MVLYEHAITLSGEVEYMWTRRFSWSSGLFFINRYGLLSGQVVLLLEQFGWPGLDDHVRRICWLDSSMFFPHSPPEVWRLVKHLDKVQELAWWQTDVRI